MSAKQHTPSRRQEKVARVVMQSVMEAIRCLADPRIEGIVSVTHVDMSSDLRNADVYLSIYTDRPGAQRKTFEAIVHATRHIQTHVADVVRSKFCPVLKFHQDDKFKKTLEIMNLIDQAASEYQDKDTSDVETSMDSDVDQITDPEDL